MTDLGVFLEQLSSGDPTPGGGSVAALQEAMAASLIAMVANLTIGKKRFEQDWQRAQLVLDEATRLRDEAIGLVDLDSHAYSRVAEALALPRSSEDEKASRRARVQQALRDAALPPLQTMRVGIDIVRLAVDLVSFGNPNAISDIGTAALAAHAGYRAARLNVLINVEALTDNQEAQSINDAMRPLSDPEGAVKHVLTRVEGVITGSEG